MGGGNIRPVAPWQPAVPSGARPPAGGAPGVPAVPPATQNMLDRQREAALQAANRYAAFAAAEEARKGVPAAADALRQQITEAGLEQSALQNAARMRAREAVEQGSVAGDELLNQFRDFVTSSLPTQQKTGGGTPKIRLSDEMIQQAARTAAAPYLRGR